MKYIIGLGNPGNDYQHNRHNVGFMVLESFVTYLQITQSFNLNKKSGAEVLKTSQYTFIKPMNYMNNSGQVARSVIAFYEKNYQLEDIFVIHDDLDIALGEFKIQQAKGPKVHNGLLDLDTHLGGNQYWHVRIGVDNRNGDRTMSGSQYVLANFTQEEKDILNDMKKTLFPQLKAQIEK